jgi:tetratricopeptide (TPR) repeat protein
MRASRLALGLVVLLLLVGRALAADSPLVAELDEAARTYHVDPARLDRVREGLEKVADGTTPSVTELIAAARVELIWGDVHAKSVQEKITAYDRGRQAARRAVEQSPRDARAHLWYGINTARYGQTRGIMNSLSLLGTVKEEMRTTLELDPTVPAAYALAGYVYLEVPRLFGGDLARAEDAFRHGLQIDPHYTNLRIGLAKVLLRQGRTDEARKELQTVLDEKTPTHIADWTVRDAPTARELLR